MYWRAGTPGQLIVRVEVYARPGGSSWYLPRSYPRASVHSTLAYHEQFIFKIGAPRLPFLLWRKLGRMLKLTSYLSYRNDFTPRKGFVAIQATPHRIFWVGSRNNLSSLHMNIFIIKTTRPAKLHICMFR